MNDEFDIFRSISGKDDSDNQETTTSEPPSPLKEENIVLSKKPTILIIDDHIHVREALKLTFEKKYDVVLCENGEIGIENVNANVFAVILDIKMEGKNGFETFTEIKKKNMYIPVIFLTAYQDLKDPFEIINDYRPFGYVIKGADSKQLLDTTESAVSYYLQINKNAFLVKALQSKNMILNELRNGLEETVEKRTEELINTNKELQNEIEFRQKAENEIKALLKEKEIILTEVHHRIKNNMTTLQALLNLQVRTLKEPSAIEALQEAGFRIQSMMILYDKLYQSSSFEEISVKEYIPSLVNEIVKNFPNYQSANIEIEVEDFILDAKRLQPLGIMINEILTNIMKYAFTNRMNGQIILQVGLKTDLTTKNALITIHDNGNGLPESVDFNNSKGFGLRLIELLAKQLKGSIKIERNDGTKFILEFKL
jgi:two-component sensor histidine kinase/CheY-like chemotaxis protein